MANQEHLEILKQGVDAWNQWRKENPGIKPDLKQAKLEKINLSSANLSEVRLKETNLREANLREADLTKANLFGAYLNSAILIKANLSAAQLKGAHLSGATFVRANLSGANLTAANLSGANLSVANLYRAILREANLSKARLRGTNLSDADLSHAILVKTNLKDAILTNCSIYGVSAWDVQLEGATQFNLVITRPHLPIISVDNLEVAQFIYLLLNSRKIRDVIDTIARKAVLILGRFTTNRKKVLDALREELRKQDYLPILFDFDKPASRDITETVSTLAHLSRFVIADLTDAKSIPQELMLIVPNLPSVPVQPLILTSQHEYGMFEHFTRYSWVLPVYRYRDEISLLQSLQEHVIAPAEQKAKEIEKR
jgi:uncharacterized protein YjbI with pentapeptide repeats